MQLMYMATTRTTIEQTEQMRNKEQKPSRAVAEAENETEAVEVREIRLKKRGQQVT